MRYLALAGIIMLLPIAANAANGSATFTVNFVGADSTADPNTVVRDMPNVMFDSTVQLGACPLVDGMVYFESIGADTKI
ncbi:MAG: hypothetical protein HY272_03100 [Gammaproteobacteria bacterium]|nr:hypothetical protein [Gammaproteobacteria bacterium]